MFMSSEDKNAKGNDRWRGFYPELIKAMSKRAKFKYNLYETKSYGHYVKGFWSGVVKELLEGVTYTCIDNY